MAGQFAAERIAERLPPERSDISVTACLRARFDRRYTAVFAAAPVWVEERSVGSRLGVAQRRPSRSSDVPVAAGPGCARTPADQRSLIPARPGLLRREHRRS